ncbi:MAG: HypC/HybG/HupF family hydrogenase formation chaperone [Nitrososphaerales archaeon]
MCLAFPGKILEINGNLAKVDFGGGTRREDISLALVDAKLGDYVLVHAGYAIQVLDEEEVKKTLELWKEFLSQP